MTATDTIIYEPFYTYDTLPQESTIVEDTAMLPIDSVFYSYTLTERPIHKSLFTHHQLQPENSGSIARHQGEDIQWIFGVIVILIAALCAYSRINRLGFFDVLKSMVDSRAMNRTIRELNLNRRNALLPIAFIVSTIFTLIIFHYANYYIESILSVPNYLSFLYILVATTILFIARNGFIRFIGNTFEQSSLIGTYIISNYFYFLCESIILIPLCMLHYFTIGIGNIAINIILIIVAIIFCARLFRGFKLILTISKASSLQLFYYLCILELVPILILAKVITSA